ncbi:hypothetical protein KFL_007540010 [Klebsormidium nitens]|uniref:Uncharacterized protein n=1 Tax=Klebsormidium nitens TaxID=105231 RepID=A0A1Y1IMA3_KLENI|nr:hypothetical protein KFL_007540010 [Klebsormidium nitens]|eukprot:GAQ91262.1 hypothetical protein KFL_007540010 [Klebsormidium nitens]
MVQLNGAPDHADEMSLIGIRTRRGTLLQGATETPEQVNQDGGAANIQQESHWDIPSARDPSDDVSRDRHVSATNSLSEPRQGQAADEVPRGTPPFKENRPSLAPLLGQAPGGLLLRNRKLELLQGGYLPGTQGQLAEAEGRDPPLQGAKLSGVPEGRDPVPGLHSQPVLQEWQPRSTLNLSRTAEPAFGLQSKTYQTVARATTQETQTAQDSNPRQTSEALTPTAQTYVSASAGVQDPVPPQRLRTPERLWHNYHYEDNRREPDPPQFVPPFSTLARAVRDPPDKPPEEPPRQQRGQAMYPAQVPGGGFPGDPPPTPSVKSEPESAVRPRLQRGDDSAETKQPDRTPRIFQPIKVVTYKGTKKEEGFQAQRFIKRMETYLCNTPGLTDGQMGLTLFHNLTYGAQDWVQSADDAYMDLTGESLLQNWDALKEKFLNRTPVRAPNYVRTAEAQATDDPGDDPPEEDGDTVRFSQQGLLPEPRPPRAKTTRKTPADCATRGTDQGSHGTTNANHRVNNANSPANSASLTGTPGSNATRETCAKETTADGGARGTSPATAGTADDYEAETVYDDYESPCILHSTLDKGWEEEKPKETPRRSPSAPPRHVAPATGEPPRRTCYSCGRPGQPKPHVSAACPNGTPKPEPKVQMATGPLGWEHEPELDLSDDDYYEEDTCDNVRVTRGGRELLDERGARVKLPANRVPIMTTGHIVPLQVPTGTYRGTPSGMRPGLPDRPPLIGSLTPSRRPRGIAPATENAAGRATSAPPVPCPSVSGTFPLSWFRSEAYTAHGNPQLLQDMARTLKKVGQASTAPNPDDFTGAANVRNATASAASSPPTEDEPVVERVFVNPLIRESIAYVAARIGGVRGLERPTCIDSGADVNVMSLETVRAASLEHKFRPGTPTFLQADGSSTTAAGWVDTAVGLGKNLEICARFLVQDNLNYDVLLGTTSMKKVNGVINFQKGRFEFQLPRSHKTCALNLITPPKRARARPQVTVINAGRHRVGPFPPPPSAHLLRQRDGDTGVPQPGLTQLPDDSDSNGVPSLLYCSDSDDDDDDCGGMPTLLPPLPTHADPDWTPADRRPLQFTLWVRPDTPANTAAALERAGDLRIAGLEIGELLRTGQL